MIVAKQFVQEVQSLCADQVLVLAVDKPLPPFTGVSGGQEQESLLFNDVFRNRNLKMEARPYLPRMSLNRGSSSMLYLSM